MTLIPDDFKSRLKEARVWAEALPGMTIENAEDCENARLAMVNLNKTINDLDDARAAAKKPHLDAGRRIDAEFKPHIAMLEKNVMLLKTKLADYALVVERQRRLAEMERLAKEELADREALEEGRTARLVTDVYVPPPADISLRDHTVYEVTDVNLIPREFMVPDMDKIKAAHTAGIAVPGVAVRTIKQVIAR